MTDCGPDDRVAAQQATLATPLLRHCLAARAVFWLEDLAWGKERTLCKFKAQEIVAWSPYRAWQHGADDDTAAAEADNEQAHRSVLQAALDDDGIQEGRVRYGLLPRLGAAGMYLFTWFSDRVRPAWGYRLNADIEDHAEHEYALFVAEHPEFESLPHDAGAVPGYGEYVSRADVLRQLGVDEGVHKQLSLDRLTAAGAPRPPLSRQAG